MNTSTKQYVIPCRSRLLNVGAWCVLAFLAVFWAAVGAGLMLWLR